MRPKYNDLRLNRQIISSGDLASPVYIVYKTRFRIWRNGAPFYERSYGNLRGDRFCLCRGNGVNNDLRILVVIARHKTFLFFSSFFLAAVIANGLSEIGGSSEARELLVSRGIVDGGPWLLPMRNNVIASKPPLMHWCTALIGSLFGGEVSIWLQRTVSTLIACSLLFVVTWFVTVVGKRDTDNLSLRRALFAFFLLATSPTFFRIATDARVDMLLSFFIVAAICTGLVPLIQLRSLESVRRYSFVYPLTFMGLAVLSKGPIGIALPVAVLFVCYWRFYGFVNTLRLLLKPQWSWLCLFLTGPLWYLAGAISGGEPFLERHLLENLSRVSGGEHIVSQQWWYYLGSWIKGMPWVVFFPVAFMAYRKGEWGEDEREGRMVFSLLVWCLLGTVLLSCSSGKRHSYILSLVPAMACFLALWFVKRSEQWSGATWQRLQQGKGILFWIIGVLLLIGLSFVLPLSVGFSFSDLAFSSLERYGDEKLLLILLSLGLPLFLFSQSMRRSLEPSLQWCFLGAAVISSCLSFNGIGQGIKAEFKGYHRFAEEIHDLSPQVSAITVVKEWHDELFDPLLAYLEPAVHIVSTAEAQVREDEFVILRENSPIRASFRKTPLLRHRSIGDLRKERYDRALVLFGPKL